MTIHSYYLFLSVFPINNKSNFKMNINVLFSFLLSALQMISTTVDG